MTVEDARIIKFIEVSERRKDFKDIPEVLRNKILVTLIDCEDKPQFNHVRDRIKAAITKLHAEKHNGDS